MAGVCVIVVPVSQYASYSAMFCLLHTNISKEQYESISEIHPAIMENTDILIVKHVSHISMC